MTGRAQSDVEAEVGHGEVLAEAVRGIGGSERPGQVEMADAIADALESGQHLLVQAGTGTGKSLTLRLVALGVVLGAAAGLWAARLVSTLLFDLEPYDLPTLAAATAALLGIALLAASLPARRASRIDPARCAGGVKPVSMQLTGLGGPPRARRQDPSSARLLPFVLVPERVPARR